MNGAVPLESGRQKSSGITFHTTNDVKFYNNISWARFDDDYGYQVYGDSQNFDASNNILAKGKSRFTEGKEFIYGDPLFADINAFDFLPTYINSTSD